MLCLHFALSRLDNYEKYSFPSMSLVLLQLKNFSSTSFSRQYFLLHLSWGVVVKIFSIWY